MKQLVLDLSQSRAFGRADFIASDSNAAALGWITRWPEWPSSVLVLHGAQGAGKTHLAHLWRERAAAILIAGDSLDEYWLKNILERNGASVVIDDANRASEAILLHVFNACLEAGGNLLLTSRQALGPWRPALADLGSRLRAAPAVEIGLPDDALIGAVLVKHFADRQVRVASEVIAYLVRHMDRSLAAAAEVAAALDAAALTRNGPITIPLAKRILAGGGDHFLRPKSDVGVT
jgi:chromosomal replication initiation ATPase DnaA